MNNNHDNQREADLDRLFRGVLGGPTSVSPDWMWDRQVTVADGKSEAIRAAFERAGWYERTAIPYSVPTTEFAGKHPKSGPRVSALRRLWMVRFNPGDPDFDERSDVAVDFPWLAPETAPMDGWWLSTRSKPNNRQAIEGIDRGDLVVVQRSCPPDPNDAFGQKALIGLAAMLDDWWWFDDVTTRRWQRDICLIPVCRFKHWVPRQKARDIGRLVGRGLSHPPQCHEGSSQMGFTLSAVRNEDAVELLTVCGIHPEVLAEPHLPTLAARLNSSETGNEDLLQLLYDHRLQNDLRRIRERDAVRRCMRWALKNGYMKPPLWDFQECDGAGFDLLFIDDRYDEAQFEVKGYRPGTLSMINLQPSQEKRARSAARGTPPEWFLYAVLGAAGKAPRENLKPSSEVVKLINGGVLKVRNESRPKVRDGDARSRVRQSRERMTA